MLSLHACMIIYLSHFIFHLIFSSQDNSNNNIKMISYIYLLQIRKIKYISNNITQKLDHACMLCDFISLLPSLYV